jgi:glycosyltransferase involved in cell wall biosynthesis
VSSSEPDAGIRIAALIPAHNEASRIGPVVRDAARFLPVYVVDDGSTDETAAVARADVAAVIQQQPNQGKGAALRSGFRQAIEDGFDAVITLDGDGQHDPADIPAFLAAYRAVTGNRPDLVIGRRSFRDMPFVRRLSNELGMRAVSWALGQNVPDNQSGFRLIGRRVMQRMLDSDEAGFEFEVDMITTCIRLGGRIEWVPIRTIYAGESSHIRPLHHLASFVRVVVAARRAVRTPLR